MEDLFPSPPLGLTWKPSAARPVPAILLRELVLLRTVAPYDPIRHIPFHPGLNIVWADPKLITAKKGGSRLAGHSAGKSTLCRIIRWLLGENRYGNAELQDAIGTHFAKGLAALHLEIDGTSWVVGRSFWNSQEYWARRSNSIDETLSHGVPEDHELPEFVEALQSVTIGPLARQHLPGASENLDSLDLLAWLTRVQDCALQTVEAWREAPALIGKTIASKESRHILMRLVLDLLEDDEWKEMEVSAKLETTKSAERKRKPELESNANASCGPLRFIVPQVGKSLHGTLLVSKAEAEVAERTTKLTALNMELAAMKLEDSEKAHLDALAALSKKEQEITTSERNIKKLEKRIAERDVEEIKAAQQKIDRGREMPSGYCAKKREDIKDFCKYYEEAPTQLSSHQIEEEIQKRRDHLQEQLEDTGEALKTLESELPFLKERESGLKQLLLKEKEQSEVKGSEIALLKAEIRTAGSILKIAQDNFTELDRTLGAIKELNKRITKSTRRQLSIRKDNWKDRVEFGEIFESVLRYLMGDDAHGYVEFDSDGLFKLIPKTRTKLSSGAIDALAVIAFDLAAVFWSASGRGHHPRFLIHDSPRVADMSPVPYAAIFDVAHEAENLGNAAPNFQYLITTTEAPPDYLKTSHIILELDASTPAGRLFREDL